MLRHSISQIFYSNSPHEQEAERESAMISSLQPNRPHIQQPAASPFASPLNQQPNRMFSSATPSSSSSSSSFPSSPNPPPRSQIEAMPPSLPLRPLQILQERKVGVLLDASVRHPVFFTDRLKKSPNGVGDDGWTSPVAAGYVFNDDVRREGWSRL